MDRKQVAETIAFCLEHGTMGGHDCSGIYTQKGKGIVKEGRYRDACPNGACETGCVVTPLRESLRFLGKETRLLTLEELEKGFGHGWEEAWLIGDDEDPERFDLEECVYLHGHLILESGSTANAQSDHWQESYNKRFGMRVWEGIDPPTEAQRKAVKWNG